MTAGRAVVVGLWATLCPTASALQPTRRCTGRSRRASRRRPPSASTGPARPASCGVAERGAAPVVGAGDEPRLVAPVSTTLAVPHTAHTAGAEHPRDAVVTGGRVMQVVAGHAPPGAPLLAGHLRRGGGLDRNDRLAAQLMRDRGAGRYDARPSARASRAAPWGRGTASPAWKSNATSWPRSWAPSLSIARLTWVLDVPGLMTSRSAMAGLLRPSATARRPRVRGGQLVEQIGAR